MKTRKKYYNKDFVIGDSIKLCRCSSLLKGMKESAAEIGGGSNIFVQSKHGAFYICEAAIVECEDGEGNKFLEVDISVTTDKSEATTLDKMIEALEEAIEYYGDHGIVLYGDFLIMTYALNIEENKTKIVDLLDKMLEDGRLEVGRNVLIPGEKPEIGDGGLVATGMMGLSGIVDPVYYMIDKICDTKHEDRRVFVILMK